ncbi:efflux RND transporter periplasmic adaptor subunit [Candidatus Curtissbacteria bacterium]|nr:efflux RND transporter periplasmic adaptor subunit [Candidatus Curtissbacteria bacterium]
MKSPNLPFDTAKIIGYNPSSAPQYLMFNLNNFKKRFARTGAKPKIIYRRTLRFIDRRPLTSFFALLVLLLVLIALGNFMRKPRHADQNVEVAPKIVQTYTIGATPKITVQGQIEKSGIVKITAQTPGIVSQINVKAGQQVWRGTNLLSLSSNYSGSNPLSVARQLAGAQYKNIVDTFPMQKDLIGKQ